jgi:hypothetical protein
MNSTLIQDARHVLNHRSRGHEARMERLVSAGVPAVDRESLAAWLQDAEDANHSGVYYACTVREDLPVRNKIGCRIVRVPIKAHLVEAGEATGEEDEDGQEVVAQHAFWTVLYGHVGPGYMEPMHISRGKGCMTAEDAERKVRLGLLARGDCFETRAQAKIAVAKMLAARANS